MRHTSAVDGVDAPRARILVIDHDEELCDVIGKALRGTYAVASAPHGAAALDLVKTHEPALILLDPRLPIMDGWSFVQQYRRIAASPAKIVAMSIAPDLPRLARQLGADGHLCKPFRIDELEQAVAHHLTVREPPSSGQNWGMTGRS